MEDYLEELEEFDKVYGLYENYLERDFYFMGGELFESFDDCKIDNHEYCEESLGIWHSFQKTIVKSPASPMYNELKVAISEIIELV